MRAITKNPASPFGFHHRLQNSEVSAFTILMPPAWPYAIGLAIRAGLPQKILVLPLSLILVVSLRSLLRRFAPGISGPLLWMTASGAAILPATNLMLDIPEITLALAAIAVNQKAHDRSSVSIAALAGVLAGLAAQVKYNGLIVPIILIWQSIVSQRPRLGLSAAIFAAVGFVGFELLFSRHDGSSHFLYHFAHPGFRQGLSTKLIALVASTGGLIPSLPVIVLAALDWKPRLIDLVACLIVGLLAILPFLTILPLQPTLFWYRTQMANPPLEGLVFGGIGLLLLGTFAVAVTRSLRDLKMNLDGGTSIFLMGWVAIEVVGYFGLSPFPASRRFIGLVIALTILAGHLASRTGLSLGLKMRIGVAAAIGVVWGLVLASVDFEESRATSVVTRQGAIFARESAARSGRKAYVSTVLASDLIAGDEGLEILPIRGPLLCAGDRILIVGGDWTVHPDFPLGTIREEYRDSIVASFPMTTMPCYYLGTWPIQRLQGYRALVSVYEVLKPCRPTERTTIMSRQQDLAHASAPRNPG